MRRTFPRPAGPTPLFSVDGRQTGNGLRDRFELLLAVEDAGLWKPAERAYADALRRCDVGPAEAMLVAVHPWDVDGAARAGLATAWITRDEGRYPGYFRRPDVEAPSLPHLAELLT